MATQSLYRRYRPRRFAEVKGQDHVVKALRNAVINQREGQAYLFSGPRGTGKTTSARILAKVLNCEQPVDGEPCCACESCLAVEAGRSFDVHELDAASNNGVEAMRDLIDKAALGTPGRHKVYILDEVHMLSKAAEAALLKTLEEPPPHVVFVLATTDPQKVSETIRSRTQHLAFHLLPMDVLEQHIRWLAGDAGISIDDDALESVLRAGGGSARDTVSALELVAAGGGSPLDALPLDEFLEALIEMDPARGLTLVAHAIQNGREPRVLTDDLIRLLRDCFLMLMAPELVQLPTSRQAEVGELAERLGAGPIVRAMERLGEMVVEMRHAPDPRVLLEVAVVQLTRRSTAVDLGSLADRLERVEQAVAAVQATGGVGVATEPPVDPTTGKVVLGGRAQRAAARSATAAGGIPRPRTAPPPAEPTTEPPVESPVESPVQSHNESPAVVPPTSTPAAAAAPDDVLDRAAAAWPSVGPTLRGLAKPLFAGSRVIGRRDGALLLGAPNAAHLAKCEQQLDHVKRALGAAVGADVEVAMVIDTSPDDDRFPTRADSVPSGGFVRSIGDRSAAHGVPRLHALPSDDEIDPDDIAEAEVVSAGGPDNRIDAVLQAFPGSVEVEE